MGIVTKRTWHGVPQEKLSPCAGVLPKVLKFASIFRNILYCEIASLCNSYLTIIYSLRAKKPEKRSFYQFLGAVSSIYGMASIDLEQRFRKPYSGSRVAP